MAASAASGACGAHLLVVGRDTERQQVISRIQQDAGGRAIGVTVASPAPGRSTFPGYEPDGPIGEAEYAG